MKVPVTIPAVFPEGSGIRGCTTTRAGGVSEGEYRSLNLAAHVGDFPDRVKENRRRLRVLPEFCDEPAWLEQVHGKRVAIVAPGRGPDPQVADAAVCRAPGAVLAVLTADCLPVLLADPRRRVIAIAHAGWRGLAGGVLEETLNEMQSAPDTVHAWLGPAIGPKHFEVGEDVFGAFTAQHAKDARFFASTAPDKWLADLPGLATARLARLGVTRVVNSGLCTYSDPARFYSFRRDGECGRTASLLWLDPSKSKSPGYAGRRQAARMSGPRPG